MHLIKRLLTVAGAGVWVTATVMASGETSGTLRSEAITARSTTATLSETSAPAKIYYTNGEQSPVVMLTVATALKIPSLEVLQKGVPSTIVVLALWDDGKLLVNTTPLRDLTEIQFDYNFEEFQLPAETVKGIIAQTKESNRVIREARPPRSPDDIELRIDVKSTTSGSVLDSSAFPFQNLTTTTENGTEPIVRDAVRNLMQYIKNHQPPSSGQHRGYWRVTPPKK